jgi:hypothetical protein
MSGKGESGYGKDEGRAGGKGVGMNECSIYTELYSFV